MRAAEAAHRIEQALQDPVQTWGSYSPAKVPIAVFDEDEVIYFNHPDPPAERPRLMTAATAMEINSLQTATLPAWMCKDERSLLPLLYHEAFHAYQSAGAFIFNDNYNYILSLAFYPELDPAYRATCAVEAAALNEPEPPLEQLSALARRRLEIYAGREGVDGFAGSLERREGSAAYVESRARAALFDEQPAPVQARFGWSRQYSAGAALCRALDAFLPSESWQTRVEAGESPTRILASLVSGQSRQPILELDELESQHAREVRKILEDVEGTLKAMQAGGTFRLHLPAGIEAQRAFNPQDILSLGDGRLFHPSIFKLFLSQGDLSIQGETFDNVKGGEILFRAAPHTLEGDRLEVQTETVQVSLSGVTRFENGDIYL